MEALKYEIALHQALLGRITALLSALESRASEAATANPGQLAFQAVMESAGDKKDDALPPVPEGLRVDPNQPKTYSAMMAGLLDQVNKAMAEKNLDGGERYTAMMEEIRVHETQVKTLIKESGEELVKLEKEEGKKITSEGMHTGFDSSFVSKAAADGGDSTKVELLNPNYSPSGESSSSGTAKDASSNKDDDDLDASPAARKFADIKSNEYSASLEYLSKNPQILTEKETDGLLVLAFDAALENKDDRAKQCVHQALLLQYCRSLGRDGVALFFKRITASGGNNAKEVFYKDVQDTYMRIRTRAREIVAERANEPEGVEQIQLHAVEPGTVIAISVPPADSEDPEVQEAREIYEHFSEDMRAALETGELDKVNEVLGKMSVEEAEEYVNLFGEANILSLEEQIIDGTTEEGQQQIKDLEAKAKTDKVAEAEEEEKAGDPE